MKEVFEALCFSNNGAHDQIAMAVCDHVGKRTDDDLAKTKADCESIKAHLKKVLDTHAESCVGVGQVWQTKLFSDEAVAAWESAIEKLDTEMDTINPLMKIQEGGMMNAHIFPLVQYATNPNLAAQTSRGTSGVSFLTGVALNEEFFPPNEPGNPFAKSNCFVEFTLAPAADKQLRGDVTAANPDPVGLTRDEVGSKSLGSFAWDAASVAISTRNADGSFKREVLLMDNKQTVVAKQFLSSCKQGQLTNLFGSYTVLEGVDDSERVVPLPWLCALQFRLERRAA